MWTYQAPLREMRFVIEEVLQAPAAWASTEGFRELDTDTARQIAEEAARFASEVLAPFNGPGDLEGCRHHEGQVSTPSGYREAYASFVEAGWPALACAPDVGGQGLPHLLNTQLYEMLSSANHSWTMYPGLLQGAYDCLYAHASDELKAAYLPKVVSGEWLSTMCLTEAHAGSDLGLLRTRAEPSGDASFRLTGTKIFISGGDHDLSENIVHLVLARLPDAPAGTRGLSLFLVPKRLQDAGQAWLDNGVYCDGIEKKMGIKGSATCVIRFDGARGWLIGEPHRGLAAMFVMMNAARVHVAVQGVGHAESAWQNAMAYAAERQQSRAPSAPASRGDAARGVADPIAWHPAMRRTLLGIQARLEGARLVAYETAHLLDLSHHAADEAQRREALDIVSLLTPIAKAWHTDNGFRTAWEAQQVFGGHGYVHDYGIEQSVRDSRISMIYEGTNEIQAIDLLVRKGLPDGGRRLAQLFDWIERSLPDDAATPHAVTARAWLERARAATRTLVASSAQRPEAAHEAADPYLHLLAFVLLGAAWARMDAVANAALEGPQGEAFHRRKRVLAAHFFQHVMLEAQLHLARVEAVGAPLAELEA